MEARAFDPRLAEAYSPAQSARWFRLPPATVRAWAAGQHYRRGSKRGFFRPVIQPTRVATSRQAPLAFSFVNLVELHVLSSLRRVHNLSLPTIRRSLEYLAAHFPDVEHPLADLNLQTDGLDLWLEQLGNLVAVSRHGQYGIRDVVEAHLKRISRGADGKAIRLYPFTRPDPLADEQPRAIEFDPLIAFGRPTVAGSGIPTSIIAGRFNAGETLESLALDYGRPQRELEEAIRWESRAAA